MIRILPLQVDLASSANLLSLFGVGLLPHRLLLTIAHIWNEPFRDWKRQFCILW